MDLDYSIIATDTIIRCMCVFIQIDENMLSAY